MGYLNYTIHNHRMTYKSSVTNKTKLQGYKKQIDVIHSPLNEIRTTLLNVYEQIDGTSRCS